MAITNFCSYQGQKLTLYRPIGLPTVRFPHAKFHIDRCNRIIDQLKPNSITLSRSQTWSQTCSELQFGLSRTIWLAIMRYQVCDQVYPSMVSDLSQIGSSYLDMSR